MSPGGITGGNEKQRLVFLRRHLWPLQLYVYVRMYTYLYVCQHHTYVMYVYMTDIQRVTYIYRFVVLHPYFGAAGCGL